MKLIPLNFLGFFVQLLSYKKMRRLKKKHLKKMRSKIHVQYGCFGFYVLNEIHYDVMSACSCVIKS